jgi:hypothetical protein
MATAGVACRRRAFVSGRREAAMSRSNMQTTLVAARHQCTLSGGKWDRAAVSGCSNRWRPSWRSDDANQTVAANAAPTEGANLSAKGRAQ